MKKRGYGKCDVRSLSKEGREVVCFKSVPIAYTIYRDEIETRNQEEIPFSLRIVTNSLSVAEGQYNPSIMAHIFIAIMVCQLLQQVIYLRYILPWH